jgi:transposase
VDFGTGAWIVDSAGKRRRPWVLRIVLSHSRKAYSEAVYRQTTEEFIKVLENAFHYFGGVPRALVIDNLRAAVRQADWYDRRSIPVFNHLRFIMELSFVQPGRIHRNTRGRLSQV